MNRLFLVGIVAGLTAALGLAGMFSALSTQSTAQMMGSHTGMIGNNMMSSTSQVAGQQEPWYWTNKASFGSSGVSNVENVQVTGISITDDKQVTVNLLYSGNGTAPSVVLIASTNPMGIMGGYGGVGMMGGMHSGMMGGYYGMGPEMMYGYGYPSMMYGYGSGLQDGGQWQQMQSTHGQMMGGYSGAMGPGMMQGHNVSPATTADFNNTKWKQWNEQMIQFHNQMIQSNGQLNSTQWSQMQAMHNTMMAQAPPTMMALMHGETWNGTATTAPFAWQQPLIGSAALSSGWTSNAAATITLVGDGSAFDTNNVSVIVYPLTS